MAENSQPEQQQQQPLSQTTYTVAVKTSDVRNAGTDANVYVQLTGEIGTGPQLHLKTSINHRNKFERNHSDVFLFHDQQPQGPLKQLKIWHDNSGIGPGWHLQVVEVHDGLSGVKYSFPCNQWLDKKEGDKQICRVLKCQGTKQKVPKQLRIAAEQARSQQQQQPVGHGQMQNSQVTPTSAANYGSSPPGKSTEQEKTDQMVIVPKEAPIFHMFPYGIGYGYGCYPYYGYGYGYPYYGYGFGMPYRYGGYGYGYPYYDGYGGYGLGGFGAGLMLGGFMGHSWSWSFC